MADAAVTQDEPTQPRPVGRDGRTLDRWGLPFSGPARAAALAGRVDPELDPTGWRDTPAPEELLLTDTAPDAPAPAPAAPAASVIAPALTPPAAIAAVQE